jgi:hypothetical protein
VGRCGEGAAQRRAHTHKRLRHSTDSDHSHLTRIISDIHDAMYGGGAAALMLRAHISYVRHSFHFLRRHGVATEHITELRALTDGVVLGDGGGGGEAQEQERAAAMAAVLRRIIADLAHSSDCPTEITQDLRELELSAGMVLGTPAEEGRVLFDLWQQLERSPAGQAAKYALSTDEVLAFMSAMIEQHNAKYREKFFLFPLESELWSDEMLVSARAADYVFVPFFDGALWCVYEVYFALRYATTISAVRHGRYPQQTEWSRKTVRFVSKLVLRLTDGKQQLASALWAVNFDTERTPIRLSACAGLALCLDICRRLAPKVAGKYEHPRSVQDITSEKKMLRLLDKEVALYAGLDRKARSQMEDLRWALKWAPCVASIINGDDIKFDWYARRTTARACKYNNRLSISLVLLLLSAICQCQL